MTEIKTHWKKIFNPEYIGAYAFQPGEEKTVTIAKIDLEVVTGPEGRKEERTVLRFAEPEKPLILNRTNAKTIQKLYQSPYVEDWIGKAITLGVETVSSFGEKVEAVRVKKKLPVIKQTPCTECGQIITASGKFTADQIIRSAQSRFSRPVCMDCAQALKDKEAQENQAAQAVEETTQEVPHDND